jgi:hypothetical protein
LPSVAAILGVTTGLASLVRPTLQYFPLILAMFVACQPPPVPKRWQHAVLVLAGFLLVLTPWVARNWVTLHVTSDTTLMKDSMLHGMYPNLMFENRSDSYGYPYRFDPHVGRIGSSISTVFTELARRFREQPGEHLRWFLIGKPVIFWGWNCVEGGGDIFIYPVLRSPYLDDRVFQMTHSMMRASHGILVVLMTMGSLLSWLPVASLVLPQNAIYLARFFSLLLLYFVLIHMVGFPIPRYAVPLRPFQYAMACFAPYVLHAMLRRRFAVTGRSDIS